MKNRTDPDSSLTTSSWWRSVLHNEIFRIEDEDYYEETFTLSFLARYSLKTDSPESFLVRFLVRLFPLKEFKPSTDR